MTDITIRIAEPEDLEGVISLWHDVFGDDEEFIRVFLSALACCGYTAAAFQGKEICSITTVIRDLSMEDQPCSYLYAVATRNEYRGRHLASRILDFCRKTEEELGRLVFTAPAEPELFSWYEKTIHAKHIVSCRLNYAETQQETPLLSIEKIDAPSYGILRERILAGHPHVTAGSKYLHLTDILCTYYGGGLYRIGTSIAAVYPEEEMLHCQELLTGSDSEDAVVQTILHSFQAHRIKYRIPGSGTDYITAVSPFPHSEWFGLIMD